MLEQLVKRTVVYVHKRKGKVFTFITPVLLILQIEKKKLCLGEL